MLYWRSRCNFHTVSWGAVGCEWATTSVYFEITYVVCFIPYISWVCRCAPVHTSYFSYKSIISFGHRDTIKIFKNTRRFKTWMGLVRQILIKLVTSLIRCFLRLPSDVLLGVTYANMLGATQWPLQRASHLPGSVWYGGPEARWSYLRYDWNLVHVIKHEDMHVFIVALEF